MNDSSPVNISRMPDQAILLITAPRQFFRTMPTTGGYGDPIAFMIVMGIAAAMVQIILNFIGLGHFGMVAMAATGLLSILLLPLMMIVGGFIMAALAYAVWRFLGSTRDFETAFRCIAYSAAISPVVALAGVVPYVGGLAHIAWAAFLMFIASIETHNVKPANAKIVFLVLGVFFAVMSVINEYNARVFQEKAEVLREEMLGLENLEGKTPEEMGEALGEFLKGLEKAANSQQNGDSQ